MEGVLRSHEYSLIGHNRATVGRYLWATAVLLGAAGIAATHYVAAAAQSAGLTSITSKALAFPVGAGSIYGIAYLIFNNWIWKIGIVSQLFGLPDLTGKWICKGETVGGDHLGPWSGEITISQTWDKIWVYLVTDKSKSSSVSASIIKEPGVGFILMYSYKNEIDINAGDMHSHVGYCEIALDQKAETGKGEYFNSKGRTSFGTMKISKLVK